MENKSYLLYLAFFLILLIFQPFVSANFVCGELKDNEKVSASWFNVQAYYTEKPEEITNCIVSPEDNKFCCDPEDIEGVQWAIGKSVEAKVFDEEKGYLAGPVSLVISGEGIDIFPELQLEEAITVHAPNSSIFSSQSLFFNVSMASRFNSLRYVLNGSFEIRNVSVCNDCQNSTFTIKDLPYGQYILTLIASNENEEMSKDLILTRTNQISFSRDIECRGCEKNYVPAMRRVTLKVNLQSSENVSGILHDYFPVDWKFFKSDGIVEPFSETHNVISWNVSGNNITKEYTLLSPRRIITRKYYFQSKFEDILGEKDEVNLFRFYRFLPFPTKFLKKRIERVNYMNYAYLSQKNPLVMFFKDNELVSLAIFPKKDVEDIYAYTQEVERPRLKGSSMPFSINTNLRDEDIEKILIKFKIRKPNSRYELTNVSLFQYDELNESWNSIIVSKYREDERFLYYEGYSSGKGIFTIKTEQERINKSWLEAWLERLIK